MIQSVTLDNLHSEEKISKAIKDRDPENLYGQQDVSIFFCEDRFHAVKDFLDHFAPNSISFAKLCELVKNLGSRLDPVILKEVYDIFHDAASREQLTGCFKHPGQNKMLKFSEMTDQHVKLLFKNGVGAAGDWGITTFGRELLAPTSGRRFVPSCGKSPAEIQDGCKALGKSLGTEKDVHGQLWIPRDQLEAKMHRVELLCNRLIKCTSFDKGVPFVLNSRKGGLARYIQVNNSGGCESLFRLSNLWLAGYNNAPKLATSIVTRAVLQTNTNRRSNLPEDDDLVSRENPES